MDIEKLTHTVSIKFTREILIDIFKKYSGCSNIEITKIKIDSDSKKGDAYLSTVYRLMVNGTGKDKIGQTSEVFLPVIAKTIPANVARRKTFRSLDFFKTEIDFYNKVWPEMKELKDSKGIQDTSYEVPQLLYGYSDAKNDYILLEDLSYKGYRTVERGRGADQEHVLLFLKLLANFHALGIACRELNLKFEEAAKSLQETYFSEKFRPWYSGFQENNLFDVYRNAAKKELAEEHLNKINKLFATDFYGLLCKHCTVRNKLSTITQGDCWSPNFLVKYDKDGKPLNGILIDFQLARYTTLTNDLILFLYACCSEEVLLAQWDNLIEEYYKNLSSRLEQLGLDKNFIMLEELQQDIKENGIFAVGMGMECLCMSSLEEDEIADLDMIQGDNAVPLESVWNIQPFQDSRRNKKMAFLIKHAIDKGFIN